MSPIDQTLAMPPEGGDSGPPRAPGAAPPGYTIEGELGRGGMGVVYKARQVALNRPVALKMILSGEHAGPQERARFKAEAEAVAKLQHPNIVQIYEVGEHDARPFFSLEFVDGGTLAARLAGNPQPATEAAALVEVLARAVHAAHQAGIVHRDLKPANILLSVVRSPSSVAQSPGQRTTDNEQRTIPKITDFGLAKNLDADQSQTQSGTIVGTPSYMAPEQASGRVKDVGPTADIYALGAILYECLTGRPPFRAETTWDTLAQVISEEPVPPSRLAPRCPRDLEVVCLKCLEKLPARRYPTALALAEDLRRFLGGEPVVARPAGSVERAVKWARRRPALAALLGVSALAAACLLAVGLVYSARLRLALLDTEAARQEAEAKGDAARAAGAAARDALAEAEANLYLSRIATAHRDWDAGNVRQAEEQLDACPPGRRRWEWHYLKRLCRADRLTFRAGSPEVASLAFSRDGRRLVTGGGSSFRQRQPIPVRVWEAATGRPLLALQGHPRGVVTGVAFSPDGKWVASATRVDDFEQRFRRPDQAPVPDGEVVLWDAESGAVVRRLDGCFRSVSFSPDGRRLAAAGLDRSVKVWELGGRGGPLALRGGAGEVVAVAFSPDGGRLASLSAETARGRQGAVTTRTALTVWDARTWKERPALPGGTDEINAFAFSPDGKHLAAAGTDRTVRVWEDGGSAPRTLRGHGDQVMTVAFSPDGTWLASAGMDQTVRVWEVAGGRELFALRGHDGTVYHVAFAPAGAGTPTLASGGQDGMVKVWAPLARPNPRPFRGHAAGVSCVALSPDSSRLASASTDERAVRVWDVVTGREVRRLPCGALNVAFSPDGRRLVTAGGDGIDSGKEGELLVWDVEGGSAPVRLRGHNQFVISVAFSPDGKWIASAGANPRAERLEDRVGEVKVWDANGGKERASFRPARGHAVSLAFSPDGDHLAVASTEDTVRVYGVPGGKEAGAFRGHTGPVASVAFSPDGRRLAAGGADGVVLIWDAGSGRVLRSFRAHSAAVSALAYSPGEERLATATLDLARAKGEVKLWDADSVKELLALPGQMSVAFSRDGRRLAAVGFGELYRSNEVLVWDGAPGPEALALRPHGGTVFAAAFRPDGRQAASAQEDGTVRLGSPDEAREVGVLRGHVGAVMNVAYRPDGRRLASAGVDRTVRVWDAEGREVVVLRGHTGPVWGVAYSVDGARLATGSHDGTVRLWDAEEGREEVALGGHAGHVFAVAFSPDGATIASAGQDGTVRLWDVAARKEARRLTGHAGSVYAVAFSPDGRLVASGGRDGTVRAWGAGDGKERHRHGEHAGLVSGVAFSPDGRRLASCGADRAVRVRDVAGRERSTLRGHTDVVRKVAWAPDGRQLLSAGEDQVLRIWDAAAGDPE